MMKKNIFIFYIFAFISVWSGLVVATRLPRFLANKLPKDPTDQNLM